MNRHLLRIASTVLALCASGASAWSPDLQNRVGANINSRSTTTLFNSPDPKVRRILVHCSFIYVCGLHINPPLLWKNPCWQDNYDSDDDCLSTIYSAAFVAEDWIKSMPCGKDADCLPEKLSHPGTMGDSVSDMLLLFSCSDSVVL